MLWAVLHAFLSCLVAEVTLLTNKLLLVALVQNRLTFLCLQLRYYNLPVVKHLPKFLHQHHQHRLPIAKHQLKYLTQQHQSKLPISKHLLK
uniref:Putative secreted protein n=1 Tax=Panstrongylus lignarius TaxID=156445 RepID=A0A224Y405_9HEMI